MILPYRTRKTLGSIAVVIGVLLLVAVLLWACWIIWLSRYVVYTKDGAKIDFSLSETVAPGKPVKEPKPAEKIPISYNEIDTPSTSNTEMTGIVGYYVEDEALIDNIEQVKADISALPQEAVIMVNVKNIRGGFYYSSSVSGTRSSSIDTEKMDEFITWLKKSGRYTIACFPSLRDREYGLNNTNNGIHHSSRGYLWMDDMGCYWLNPAASGTINYLIQTVNELKALGFDEVVLSDYTIPQSNNIYFEGDQAQALSDAAQTIVTSCSGPSFTVSFMGSMSFTLPEGRCRLYMQNVEPAGIPDAVEASGVADPFIHLVFFTQLHDTRFDEYSVLRPLSAAH